MMSTVSSCVCSLDSIQRMYESIEPNTWADCLRLCRRCSVFNNLLTELKNFPHLLNDIEKEEQTMLKELEKTLIAVEAYVADFASRKTFAGITESSFRQGCSADFAKINGQIIKLAQALTVTQGGLYDQLRQEDLEVR